MKDTSSKNRKKIIGGNWKCKGTLKSIRTLVNDVINQAEFDAE